MTVFKTILKILNKLKGMIILYTAILVAITALNQTSGNNMTNFEDSKPYGKNMPAFFITIYNLPVMIITDSLYYG